jgi:hypothetical protein
LSQQPAPLPPSAWLHEGLIDVLQTSPAGQAMPHPAQLDGSLRMSMHCPEQHLPITPDGMGQSTPEFARVHVGTVWQTAPLQKVPG